MRLNRSFKTLWHLFFFPLIFRRDRVWANSALVFWLKKNVFDPIVTWIQTISMFFTIIKFSKLKRDVGPERMHLKLDLTDLEIKTWTPDLVFFARDSSLPPSTAEFSRGRLAIAIRSSLSFSRYAKRSSDVRRRGFTSDVCTAISAARRTGPGITCEPSAR